MKDTGTFWTWEDKVSYHAVTADFRIVLIARSLILGNASPIVIRATAAPGDMGVPLPCVTFVEA